MRNRNDYLIVTRSNFYSITAIVGIILFLTLILYFCKFHGPLSGTSNQWADFSTYFSGIMIPVLTGINIYVFYKLTIAIADEDGKRKMREDKFQEERHYNELAFRRKMLTIENQQYEVRRFEEMMNELIYLLKDCHTENDVNKAKRACLLAENYIEQMKKVYTFGMIKIDSLLDVLVQNLSSTIQGLRIGNDNETLFNNGIHQVIIQSNINDIIVKLKNEIVSTINNEE